MSLGHNNNVVVGATDKSSTGSAPSRNMTVASCHQQTNDTRRKCYSIIIRVEIAFGKVIRLSNRCVNFSEMLSELFWGCHTGTLSCSQVSAIHVKIGHLYISSTGHMIRSGWTWSSRFAVSVPQKMFWWYHMFGIRFARREINTLSWHIRFLLRRLSYKSPKRLMM